LEFEEIMCGKLDGNRPEIMCTIWKTLEHVFVPWLLGIAHSPSDEREFSNPVRKALTQRLIPILRSFASSLRVWEAVQKKDAELTELPQIL
jgi:hypothetical protein